jgi:hypothetical protein
MEEDKKTPLSPNVRVIQQMNALVREARRRAELNKTKDNLEEVLERIKRKP